MSAAMQIFSGPLALISMFLSKSNFYGILLIVYFYCQR